VRILLIGAHQRDRMERNVERAFRRAGHTTLLFDDRRARRLVGRGLTQRLALRAARRFRPDFVFLGKCLGLELDTVARLTSGLPRVTWYQDPPYVNELHRPEVRHVADVGRMCDTFFVTGYDAEWRAHGLPAKFLPAAADRDFVPVRPRRSYAAEVSFIGTGYDPGRAEFLIALSRHFQVRVWGRGWEPWRARLDWSGRPVLGRQFAAVCSSSGVSLGINPSVARGATNYASDRIWMTILAGGFYVGPGTPGLDRLLHDGVHCAWYADFEQCVQRVGHYLTHPDERERIRAQGEAFVRTHHTFDQRARNLLSGDAFENPL
jgi:hypothetical protein